MRCCRALSHLHGARGRQWAGGGGARPPKKRSWEGRPRGEGFGEGSWLPRGDACGEEAGDFHRPHPPPMTPQGALQLSFPRPFSAPMWKLLLKSGLASYDSELAGPGRATAGSWSPRPGLWFEGQEVTEGMRLLGPAAWSF